MKGVMSFDLKFNIGEKVKKIGTNREGTIIEIVSRIFADNDGQIHTKNRYFVDKGYNYKDWYDEFQIERISEEVSISPETEAFLESMLINTLLKYKKFDEIKQIQNKGRSE
jgi:hypothetical protein